MALERNRVRLDNEFIFMDYATNKTGAISSDNTVSSFTANFYATLTDTEYMTLYFGENIPENITIQAVIDNETKTLAEVINNNKLQVNIELSEKISGNNIYFTITTSGYKNNNFRKRIKRIEFGFIAKYDENDIITMEITEQVKKYCEETPENELVVRLNNNQGQFDILNPKGITEYLTENVKIKPYIGAVTTNGVEYVDMGVYYLESWNNEDDNTTTLICKNLIKKLKELELKKVEGIDGPLSYANTTVVIGGNTYTDYATGIKNYLLNAYNIDSDIDFNLENDVMSGNFIHLVNFNNLDDISIMEYLQNISITMKDIIYANREDKLVMRRLDFEDNWINENMLITDAKIKKINDINDVKIVFNNVYDTPSTNKEIMSISHKLNKSTEIIKVATDYKKHPTRILNVSNGNVQILENNNKIIFYKITGTVGNTVSFDQEYEQYINGRNEVFEYTEDNEEIPEKEKEILEINGKGMSIAMVKSTTISRIIIPRFVAHYLYTEDDEELECDFIGNPKYEAGDNIAVYTKYGYESIIVESITHKFDGGLSSSIKGKYFFNLS